MNKLFGLFLLALACWLPDVAQGANRWAVCVTTCTWNNDGVTTGIMWSSVGSGGAVGATAPVAGDAVIIDGGTCVGGTTCTITTFSGTISAASITWGACTASTTGCIVDASVNNTSFTVSSGSAITFTGSGSGTRKWLGGTGTYALTSTSAFNGCFDMGTTTNDQGSVFSGATWSCSGAAGSGSSRAWAGGGFSFGPTTFNANSSDGSTTITGANTFNSLTVNGQQFINIGGNQTITNALTITGTSSNKVVLQSNVVDSVRTISLGSASTATWVVLRGITTSGAAALTATNCFDVGLNTLANAGSCSIPSGGGGRIIGG